MIKIKKNKKGLMLEMSVIFFLLVFAVLVYNLSTDFPKLSIMGESNLEFKYTQDYQSNPLFIGTSRFYSLEPVYSTDSRCKGYGTTVKYPNPNPDCYLVTTFLNSQRKTFMGGQTLDLSDKISVRLASSSLAKLSYIPQVDAYRYEKSSDWRLEHIISIKDYTLRAEVETTSLAQLNEKSSVLVTIHNDIADFTKENAGVYVKFKSGLLSRDLPMETISLDLKQGKTSILIPIKTDELGKFSIEVEPFAKIKADSEVHVRGEKASNTYEVVLDKNTNEEENKGFFSNILMKIKEMFKGWFN